LTIAFLALGSNIEPEKNILSAVKLLSKHVKIRAASTVYLTEPLLHKSQPKYYNCVIKIATEIEPDKLKFDVIRSIEKELGRSRTIDKYAPRTIDIDLIVYGDKHLTGESLTIPDPDIRKRVFLALPLCELEPKLLLADTNESIRQVASRFRNSELMKLNDFTETLQDFLKTLSM
jgi:2-amino-4-hydroxy-6-hydroxymethyldihydropteridine diphosphokinase